jgi:acetolactate synthase-1/2/3 large subunit
MVHTVAGTANATGGLINATRSRIPMLFSAGRTPLTEGDLKGARNGGIHWAQESFDQGSMVREWVKWDYELRMGSDLEGVVDRAFAIASTEPQGPVYLTLPREVLAHEIESFEYSDTPRMVASSYTAPPQSIRDAARALAGAKHPIAIVGSLGKDPEAVGPLVQLAEALNLPVFTSGPYWSFPVTHRLHQTSPAPAQFRDADVVLTIENDVPWTPSSRRQPREDATVIALGSDPLFSDYPVRGHRIDLSVAGPLDTRCRPSSKRWPPNASTQPPSKSGESAGKKNTTRAALQSASRRRTRKTRSRCRSPGSPIASSNCATRTP